MKKLLIAILVLIAAYVIGAAVFAVANGQAEGKMLVADKQLLVDGDMEKSGTSDWGSADCTLAKVAGAAVDGKRIIELTGTGSIPRAYQNVITIGETYRVTGWAKSGDGVNRPAVDIGKGQTASASAWYGTTSQDWQRVDAVAIAENTAYVYLKASESSGTVYFDDIVVTEYTGKTTIADDQLLADGDMEKSGTGDWTSVHGATLTKESGAKNDGKYVLRVTGDGTSDGDAARQTILTPGKTFRIIGWARGDGSVKPKIASWMGTASTDWQRVDYVWTPVGTTLDFWPSPATGYVEYDDIVITEYSAPTVTGGKQLLTDGDMEAADTSAWTAGNDAVLSKQLNAAVDGRQTLQIEGTGTNFPNASQSGILTVGKQYRFKGWYQNQDTTSFARIDDGTTVFYSGSAGNTDWQYVDVVWTAGNTNLRLRQGAAGSAPTVQFDDIVVVEL